MNINTLEGMLEAMAVVSAPPANIFEDDPNIPTPGSYLTLAEFDALASFGALGPDEACYWVSVGPDGHLLETPISSPHPVPADAICVAYYPA